MKTLITLLILTTLSYSQSIKVQNNPSSGGFSIGIENLTEDKGYFSYYGLDFDSRLIERTDTKVSDLEYNYYSNNRADITAYYGIGKRFGYLMVSGFTGIGVSNKREVFQNRKRTSVSNAYSVQSSDLVNSYEYKLEYGVRLDIGEVDQSFLPHIEFNRTSYESFSDSSIKIGVNINF